MKCLLILCFRYPLVTLTVDFTPSLEAVSQKTKGIKSKKAPINIKKQETITVPKAVMLQKDQWLHDSLKKILHENSSIEST